MNEFINDHATKCRDTYWSAYRNHCRQWTHMQHGLVLAVVVHCLCMPKVSFISSHIILNHLWSVNGIQLNYVVGTILLHSQGGAVRQHGSTQQWRSCCGLREKEKTYIISCQVPDAEPASKSGSEFRELCVCISSPNSELLFVAHPASATLQPIM